MAEGHTIETYGPQPHNRNIWPYNSQAAAAPSRLGDSFVCPGARLLPTTDGYESLFDLFISDKVKESLPPGPLQFVLSKEGTECFKASMIADLADIHANNEIGMPNYSK